MVRAFNLGLVLYGHWLLLSGHNDRLLLSLGFASTLVAVAIALRMEIVPDLHSSVAEGQRGWKRHPGGGSAGFGASPSIANGSTDRSGSGWGTARSRASV